MIVIEKSSTDFALEKNQICILCEIGEDMPEIFQKNGVTYQRQMAAGIPIEYVNKGFSKGSILAHFDCIIYGIDHAETFKEIILTTEKLPKKAKDIWSNPEKYSDFKKGSEETYYKFLKFLWIFFPNEEEKRLADYIGS